MISRNSNLFENIAYVGNFVFVFVLVFVSPFDRRHHPRYCNTSYNWSGMNLQGFRCDLDFSCGQKDERTKEGVPTGPQGPKNSYFPFG